MILDNWIPILSFVNTLANSSRTNELKLGRNATGVSLTIIKLLRRNCRIILGRWSHFSWPSSAAAMPAYFGTHCTKFTSHGFSAEMLSTLLRSSAPEEHCYRFWFISSSKGAGVHPWKQALRDRA